MCKFISISAVAVTLTNKQTGRETMRVADRQAEKQWEMQTDRQTKRDADRQATNMKDGRQREIETDTHKHKHRQTDRQTDRHTCHLTCNNLPGVATKIFILTILSCSPSNSLRPPVTRPADNWWSLPTVRTTSKICHKIQFVIYQIE